MIQTALKGNYLRLSFSFIHIVLGILFLASCVQNKKILYLQGPDKKGDYPTDSVIREYPLSYKPYRLRPNDIIALRIGSLTPEEYNFVKRYEEQLGEIRKLIQYQEFPIYNSNQGGRGGQIFGRGNQTRVGNIRSEGGIPSITLDRFNTGFILDENGELGLPEIGIVNLSGLTIQEAQDLIQEKLTGYFETPIVRIQMLNFHFTIMGEVNTEARFTTYETKNTIFDAILMAGNLTEFADRKNIKIIRTVDDISQVIYVDPLDEELLMAKNYFLQPGDMIVVPPMKARFWRKYIIPDASTALAMLTAAISLFLLVEAIRK